YSCHLLIPYTTLFRSESGQGLSWLGTLLLLIGAGLTQLPSIQGVPLWAYIGVACLLTGGIACGPAAVALLLGGVRRYLPRTALRSEEHTSELQSRENL